MYSNKVTKMTTSDAIVGLNFSVLSPEKIRSISVVEVITDELYENNNPKRGGLRDPLFGVAGRRGSCESCESCEKTWSECAGHFGHFELPIVDTLPNITRAAPPSCRLENWHSGST